LSGIFDTAGLRESDDIVEVEGIRRARVAIEQADMILSLNEIDSPALQNHEFSHANVLTVGTKLDAHAPSDEFDLCISTRTGDGLELLRETILRKITALWTGSLVPNRARQVDALKDASNFIAEALNGTELDLRAESLRAAASALGRITGRVDVEQLLDVIFSQFCIGK